MDKNPAIKTVRSKFDGGRRLRQWRNNHFGSMEAVKCHPLSACAIAPDEGGTVSTRLDVKLAPVDGHMRSKAYVEVCQVLVPYQAIEKLELDAQDDAGVTEMARRRLMAGEGIGLEGEGQVTKAMNVHPKSIGGQKRVQKSARLAYIAAVNHMRLNAYFAATLLDKHQTGIKPAVLTANILRRFDGVLDPERLIDGSINLTGDLPVKGIGFQHGAPFNQGPAGVKETGDPQVQYPQYQFGVDNPGERMIVQADPENPGEPYVRVNMDGTSEITLRDMIVSQKMDELVRALAKVRDNDPVNGEEAIERALYSLKVDYDHNCQVMFHEVYELAAQHHRPTDGASVNDISGHFELSDSFSTVVPIMELGGQLITIVSVKPMETVEKQPDPLQTQSWELVNTVLDETELDEQLLRRADLESDVAAVDEDTSAFWVGHNRLLHDYGTVGPNEQQTTGVAMKSSMWVYPVPTSVTPENVNYPETGVDMYPFAYWNGGHAEYTINQVAAISTGRALGPTPIERIQLFADEPELVAAE